MSDVEDRPYRPYPWPWGQPSVLAEEEPRQATSWLDADLEDDEADSDYEGSGSDDTTSDSEASSDDDIDDSELADIIAGCAATETGWRPYSPTDSQKKVEEREDLPRQIATLVKAEQDTAAAYNPDEVVSLITQLYELLIAMGHWPEGSLRYPPHTDPPGNAELAAQLGYSPAAISLMHQLPYLVSKVNYDKDKYILGRTRFADYTHEEDVREGRHPYPYEYLDGCPDIDSWLLPLMLPDRDGWHVMLDTHLGAVRAYSSQGFTPQDTVEWRRHGEFPHGDWERAMWTEYRRAPLVPAARYLSEIIYAYRSLSRLPVINAYSNDPKEKEPWYPSRSSWAVTQEQEEQDTLLALYQECGWPDQWRRADFVAKWEAEKKEIDRRAREAREMERGLT
ncbi:hypothetical protein C8R44DRAFT_776066 [Mycena epipterygia]|nr:hypothetical protein C8R44DRAFT_776066 [Mycena epipterygia]